MGFIPQCLGSLIGFLKQYAVDEDLEKHIVIIEGIFDDLY